jgi:hypothetical protein
MMRTVPTVPRVYSPGHRPAADSMTRRADSGTGSLQAYPNVTRAAAMLGVAPSTLTRRDDLVTERRGERDVVLAPAEVMRLASIYRKRSLHEVAQELIDHAAAVSASEADQVEQAVEDWFERTAPTPESPMEFLALARRMLSPELYARVADALSEEARPLPDSVLGWTPVSED